MFDVTCRQEVGAQFQERCPTEASRAYAACLLVRLRASFGAISAARWRAVPPDTYSS